MFHLRGHLPEMTIPNLCTDLIAQGANLAICLRTRKKLHAFEGLPILPLPIYLPLMQYILLRPTIGRSVFGVRASDMSCDVKMLRPSSAPILQVLKLVASASHYANQCMLTEQQCLVLRGDVVTSTADDAKPWLRTIRATS